MEKKKLKNAMWISYWGVPTLVIVFVVTYWILGIENYLNPSVQMVGGKEELNKEEEEGGSEYFIDMARSNNPSLLTPVRQLKDAAKEPCQIASH